ncbi:MAG: hypothetical protein IJV40_00340 [Oscillospiraceae bacterium]|nr:hypothetical protein [Oscillospiraceae bacterium]
MKKIWIPLLTVALLLFCLCGCGAAAVSADPTPSPATEPEPTSTPEPTPTPTPMLSFPDGSTYRVDETRLTLHSLTHKDVAATAELLKQMPDLERIDLGTDGAWTRTERVELNAETASVERPAEATRDLTWSDLRMLQEAAPQADLDYRFVFYGRYLSTLDKQMDLNHSVMSDEGAAVREILPLMKNCRKLDMDSCGVSSEAMARIRDDYPDMEVIWRIWFANGQFTMRTDSERLWCANFYPYMTDEYTQELKYLTNLKYLDLGHNLDLHNWDFMRYMTNLEVCIITASGWDTLDMLENCTKLEFLEIVPYAHIELDLHPLAGMQDLEHLNICGMGQTEGWEVLLGMPKLKRLWIGTHTAYFFPEGAMDQILAAHPDTDILYLVDGAATGSWRLNPDGTVPERYTLLRQQFDYDHWQQVAPYPYNDPKYNPPW